jgi:hypothetical protein
MVALLLVGKEGVDQELGFSKGGAVVRWRIDKGEVGFPKVLLLHERHDAGDFDTRTQDKLAASR